MKKLLFRLIEPRAIILGFTVFYFSWVLTMWIRGPFWAYHQEIFVATLLLVSAVCLAINGGVSNLLAAVLSGWVPLGFCGAFWMPSKNAEVIPFSFEHISFCFRELFNIGLMRLQWLTVSTVILCYSLVLTTKTLRHLTKKTT